MTLPPLPFAPAAVLLDMDGLLIDSERAMLACWREASAGRGHLVEESLWHSMIGLHDADCRRLLARHFGEDEAAILGEDCDMRYRARIAAGLPLMPGVSDLLALLRRYALPRAVVTSTRRERALQKLEASGLIGMVDLVVAGCEVSRPKPAPDAYLKAAGSLSVAPERCVVLEDSVPGVRAALRAGTTPIQVPDLVRPDAEALALGHRIADSLMVATRLIARALDANVAAHDGGSSGSRAAAIRS